MALNDFIRVYANKQAKGNYNVLSDHRNIWDFSIATVRNFQAAIAICIKETIQKHQLGMMAMATKKNSQAWAEAKKRCRLNDRDIQMAKALRMTPKSLIKNIPSPNQQWKVPVKVWIRDLYEEKFDRVLTVKPVPSSEIKRKAKKQDKPIVSDGWIDEEDLPF